MSRDTYDYQGERLDSDRRGDDLWLHDLELARADRDVERTGQPAGELEHVGARHLTAARHRPSRPLSSERRAA